MRHAIQTGVTLPPEVVEAVDRIASQERRSRSNMIAVLVERALTGAPDPEQKRPT